MENNSFQTSFIPKKPIDTTGVIRGENKKGNPLTFLAVMIFILILAISGGLYFYKSYLTKQKADLSTSINKVKDSFDQNTISDLELFNKRISASEDILSKHLVLSPMFELLGSLTIPAVQYTKFDHENVDNNFTVKMSGIAPDYKSIALQADMFNSAQGRLFKDVVFSNLNKDTNNNVTFDVTFNVDPSLLSYEKNILTTAQ